MAGINDPFNYAYNFYIQHGFQPYQAAALVGNLQHESGGNPNAIGDSGTSHGAFQWHDTAQGVGRKTDLMNWALANNLDPKSLDTQLQFSLHEMDEGGSESAAGNAIRNSKDYGSAVNATLGYLRPSGYSADNPTNALGYAQRYNNGAPLAGVDPIAGGTSGGGGSGGLLQPSIDTEIANWSTYGQDPASQAALQKATSMQGQWAGAATSLGKAGSGLLAGGASQDQPKMAGAPQPQVHRPQVQQIGNPDFRTLMAQSLLKQQFGGG